MHDVGIYSVNCIANLKFNRNKFLLLPDCVRVQTSRRIALQGYKGGTVRGSKFFLDLLRISDTFNIGSEF